MITPSSSAFPVHLGHDRIFDDFHLGFESDWCIKRTGNQTHPLSLLQKIERTFTLVDVGDL